VRALETGLNYVLELRGIAAVKLDATTAKLELQRMQAPQLIQ
jgi:hypothetical protein